MKTAFLLASLTLSSFALGGLSPAQNDNQPPPQPASLEDRVSQLERQQQVMQWQLDDLRKQVAALQQAVGQPGQGNPPQPAEGAPSPERPMGSSDQAKGNNANVDTYALFYSRLQSKGKWLQDPSYGYVWQPAQATEDQNWRPYADGHWVYTDRGWTWISNEDFGWACYHYGRWARYPDTGWVWVPGNEWGPAWVSWREGEGQGDGYVGWAPLPPEAEADQNVRIESWADNYYDIGPAAYVFVRMADLAQPTYSRVIVPPSENVTIIANTRNVTNIYYSGKGFDLGGPDYRRLEQRANVRIPQYNLAYSTPGRGEDFRTVVRGDQLEVFAPPPRLHAESAARPEVTRTLARMPVDRGWRGLNQTQAAELRQTFERQAPVPAGLPPSKVERVRAAAGEGPRPAQAAEAPAQAPSPAQGTAPAQVGASPARPVEAPENRAERPEAGARPAVRPEARDQVAQPAEGPGPNRRNLTQEPREGRPNAQVGVSPTPSRAAGTESRSAAAEGRAEPQRAATPAARGTPENRPERDLERRPENESGRPGEPARAPRPVERPADAERPAGSPPGREQLSDTERQRETPNREQPANVERHRPAPAVREQPSGPAEKREAPQREESTGTERQREAPKREVPPAGETEGARRETGEQRSERNSTTSPARHVEKENGAASERESQHHEAAPPAKHRTDEEGKHREGPTNP